MEVIDKTSTVLATLGALTRVGLGNLSLSGLALIYAICKKCINSEALGELTPDFQS